MAILDDNAKINNNCSNKNNINDVKKMSTS